MPLAVQQRTEIARALVQDARVFLFDEPNSALTDEESDDLFRHMEVLAAVGHVVILVSHRLAELVDHCPGWRSSATACAPASSPGPQLTQDAIAAELVVGHTQTAGGRADAAQAGEEQVTALRLEHWTSDRGRFSDIDLDVHDGEIVALLGVEGSGARELVRSIAGFEPGRGTFALRDRSDERGAEDASQGSGFVSADRQSSLFGNLDIGDNMVARLGSEITGRVGSLAAPTDARDRQRAA